MLSNAALDLVCIEIKRGLEIFDALSLSLSLLRAVNAPSPHPSLVQHPEHPDVIPHSSRCRRG